MLLDNDHDRPLILRLAIEIHMQNDVMLQEIVSIADAHQGTYHIHKNCPTTMVDSTPKYFLEHNIPLDAYGHVSISPSAGTTADVPLEWRCLLCDDLALACH